MGILDELASATGDKQSNGEMVKRCIDMPALLHSIAEGLRTGTPKARVDCAEILVEVARRRPELLGSFVNDFFDASRDATKRIAELGFEGLVLLTPVQPAEVFAEREYLLGVAKEGNLHGASALASLCGLNANYRGKLLGTVLRLLAGVQDKDLPKWVTALAPAVEGSADAVKRLTSTVQPRRAALPEAAAKKLDKAITKLERSTAKR